MIIGMSVGVLDEKVGPSSIFNINLDDELSKKLTLKVMVGVMSFSAESDENSLRGESIIPFPKEKLITLSYLFPIKDSKARGGNRLCSLIVAFDIQDRIKLYQNASNLSRFLKSMSELVTLKHIQNANFPLSFSAQFDKLRTEIYDDKILQKPSGKSKITIVCPLCSKSNEIEIPALPQRVKLIEHQIFAKEICEHSFIAYLDSKFNVLGYKDPEIEMSDMKNMFSKLKSPYD
ncbi:MAG: hypothetical protein ACTSO7_07740 [Candidatus Heimdallarchaeota archaeon]